MGETELIKVVMRCRRLGHEHAQIITAGMSFRCSACLEEEREEIVAGIPHTD